MNKPGLAVFGAILALAGAAFLAWRWREDAGAPLAPGLAGQRAQPASLPAAPAAAPAETPVDAATRQLLAKLAAALARSDARAREALLTFKDDGALRRFRARAAQRGLSIVGAGGALRAVRVRYDNIRALEGDLLADAGDYDSVAANYLVSIPPTPAKEDRAAVNQQPFHNETLAFLGITGDHSTWGQGTTIAVLDTGVAPDATFGSGRLRYLDIGLGTAPGGGSEDGHGTGVAALAAGLAPDAAGVAPAAGILSIRVTDTSGTSDIFTLASGIVAAVDAGARILNVSLGGYATNATLNAAIDYAAARGAVIVAAAGNDQAAQLAWPAADPRVISVGAVDRAEQQVTFSNSGAQLQLAAPGYGVQTAWSNGQRVYVDGTSASAPLVAGAIAAVLSANPSLTPELAAKVLLANASDGGAPGDDPAFGHGILNLGWAMHSGTPGYVDTAVSSHYFDATHGEMDFVVQNRSSQTVGGLTLNVGVGTSGNNYTVPALAPGEIYVVRTPVDDQALRASGTLTYTTQLINPIGLVDAVPANNRRSSTLTAPVGK